MILKFIEAYVSNSSKHYSFINRDLIFDSNKSNIILPKEYILQDFNNNICYLESLYYNELLSRKLYSSISNVRRAIMDGSLDANISITYCKDIEKCKSIYGMLFNKPTSLMQVEELCSGIRYYYFPRTDTYKRTEIYGDIVLGDEFEREESYYDKFK